MNRSLLARVAVVAAALAVVPVMNPSSVGADPVEDQRAEVERITDELERLHQESDILAEDYVTAIDEKNQLDGQVAQAEDDVAAKEAEVETLRGELSEVAVRAFTGSGTDALGPMFSDSARYTESLQRDQLARVALSTGTATTDQLEQAASELEDQRAELEDMRAAAVEQAERVEQARVANEERKAEYEQARTEAEAKLGQLIEEEEERRARESFERMQREAEAAAARAAAEQAAAEAEAQQRAADPDDGSGSADDSNALAPAPRPSEPEPNNPEPTDPEPSDPDPAPEPEPEPDPAPAPPDFPPASSRAGTAVNAAMSQLGVPYRFAASEPGVAFDCSGLTSWAWGQAGVYLPHQSRQQYNTVPHVPSSAVQPGDLVFFYSPISHVSIYLGGGQQVHAPNTGSVVSVATVNWGRVTGVGRPG